MLDGAQSIDFADLDLRHTNSGNKPDPIPESQEEINKQADAAIRDLFPRIPNTDREMIIRHAFQKVLDKGSQIYITDRSRELSSTESQSSVFKQT